MVCIVHDRPWEITTETDCRFVRVGGCSILSVRVTYPQLRPMADGSVSTVESSVDDPAVIRFNRAYRCAAEAFSAWTTDAPAKAASAAFEAMGAGAAYRFARWEFAYEAVPTAEAGEGILCVTTIALWRVRRSENTRKIIQKEDLWQLPSLVRKKILKKQGARCRIAKKYEKSIEKREGL